MSRGTCALIPLEEVEASASREMPRRPRASRSSAGSGTAQQDGRRAGRRTAVSNAGNVRGGIEAWATAGLPSPARGSRGMIFRQITHDDLGCASYLIGDENAGVAAVVDPKLDIDEYLRLARYMGVQHRAHPRDPQPRRPRLRPRPARRRDRRDHPHPPRTPRRTTTTSRSTTAGSSSSARSRVRAMHTPGHRPEHTAFALIDTARGDEPWAVLTGDTLFVGDIARPDLAVDKEEGARGIFHSLTRQAAGAARRVRGLARASRRLAVRRARAWT